MHHTPSQTLSARCSFRNGSTLWNLLAALFGAAAIVAGTIAAWLMISEVPIPTGTPAPPELVTAVEELSSTSSSTRVHAIETIAQFGQQARPLALELSRLLEDQNQEVRLAAAKGLAQLEHRPVHVRIQHQLENGTGWEDRMEVIQPE